MDLYQKMDKELKELFVDLFNPDKTRQSLERMEKILKAASLIGDPIHQEAEALFEDVLKFLNRPKSKKWQELMKKHALRLSQESKEL